MELEILKDFSSGPLDVYRKKASFDWKQMKLFLHTEDVLRYENELCEILKTLPEFKNNMLSPSPTFDEERRITAIRDLTFSNLPIGSLSNIFDNTKKAESLFRTLMQLSPASQVKNFVRSSLFTAVIRDSGTEKHQKYLQMFLDGKIHGCFCLTEIGHGSNAKGMQARATYDKNTKEFVLHTPDFQAAKCWAGALGQTASYAAVFAQLYIDNVNYGLHSFVVPIRDPETLLPFPGVIVGDMGEKIGLNGVDNGFLMFENYRIPRDNLLNKNSDVTEDGRYVTKFKNASQKHGATLGSLSMGRVNIIGVNEQLGTKALTIAIRYAAVRKQFGPDDKQEVPILEYQSHQYRLLPYLAAAYAFRICSIYFIEVIYKFTIDASSCENKAELSAIGMEIHGVSSALKSLSGWLFRDAIQECREACGGHGYLKAAGIGTIRNDQDANCTYEGENHVLIQQTSNWLIKLWPIIKSGKSVSTPMHSVDFLSHTMQILKLRLTATTVAQLTHPESIIQAYQWLTCYLLKETTAKLSSLTPRIGDFWSKNNTQVFYAKTLAISFVQHFVLQRMLTVINESADKNIKNVLSKLFSLYGLWSLQKHIGILYEGGYFQGSEPSRLLNEAILQLCAEIKDDAVSLIDAIGPPDFILNSVLGQSDGLVYQHLKSAMFESPYAMSRPSWWQDIVNFNKKNSKL